MLLLSGATSRSFRALAGFGAGLHVQCSRRSEACLPCSHISLDSGASCEDGSCLTYLGT